MFRLRSVLLSAGLLLGSGAALAASAFNLGVAGNFSAFVFGDMTVTGWTDADHSVAVQGNFNAGNWTAAQKGATYSTGGKEWALVVGGNVNWANGSVIDKTESIYVGGALNVSGPYNPTLGPVQQGGSSPVNFAAVKTQLLNESALLFGKANTGTAVKQWGGVYLTGTGGASEYFTINAADLSGIWGFQLGNVAAGASIVLNIVGSATEIALNGLGWNGFAGHETLFNFSSNLSKLTLAGVNPDVSFLATNADVTYTAGDIGGTVIAKSYYGGAQLNGGHPGSSSSSSTSSTPNQVPEPGSLLLAGIALAGVARLRRRRA